MLQRVVEDTEIVTVMGANHEVVGQDTVQAPNEGTADTQADEAFDNEGEAGHLENERNRFD